MKSILILLVAMHVMDDGGALYKILVSISDATFYFLPMMVAVTTANKLKSNRLVAIAAVGVTLLPAVTAMIAEGTSLFGIQLQNIAYNAQVFPAILCVSFLALMERIMNKVSPKPIRIFFVPMVALAVTVPVTLLFLGPLGYNVGQIFTTAILFLYDKLGFVALTVLSAILPLMVQSPTKTPAIARRDFGRLAVLTISFTTLPPRKPGPEITSGTRRQAVWQERL